MRVGKMLLCSIIFTLSYVLYKTVFRIRKRNFF